LKDGIEGRAATMATDHVSVPTACSLPVTDTRDRAARWQAIGAEAKTAVRRSPALIEVDFRAGDSVTTELRSLADLERECCPFLVLAVTATPIRTTLRISAAPGTGPEGTDHIAVLARMITDPDA
jgi:hypothetical protein